MAGAQVPYTPYSTAESQGSFGGGMGVRSTPADAGAQVGEAIEGAGKQGFDLAMKQQGIINETAMTNADADFATKVGKIKGDYTSLSGQSAFNAFPQYQNDIKAAFQESRAGLPAAAQRGFDMMATRTMANHIADGSSYASSQLKEANRDSYSNVTNANLQALLDPDIASNPDRSKYHVDSIKFATQAQMDEDHPGLKKDPETGEVSFDLSKPEGIVAKADFQRKLDTNLSQAYVNRYDTLAKRDVFGAYDQYQKERSDMPKSAQVALDASFAPRIFDAHKTISATNTIDHAANEHFDMLTNPSKVAVVSTIMKNELHADGVVRVHSDGDGSAIGGINSEAFPAQFNEAKNILNSQGQDAAKKYISNFYEKEIIEKNGVDKLPSDVQDVVADGLTNHWSGFQSKLLDAAKNGASRQDLIDMRRQEYQRLATENPAKYANSLTGWNNRLDNLQVATEGKKTYATNENGAPMSLADYYRIHGSDVLAKGDAYAEQQMPGDLALRRAVRQSLQNQMSKTISEENAMHIMDNKNLMKVINEKTPETEEDLRSTPEASALLDRIAVQDPKFYESIPTIIAKVAKRNDVANSSNGYDTVLRVLDSPDNPNAIRSQDHLYKLLGHSEGAGINMKDYNDAKPAIELDSTIKDSLRKHMIDITNANGNLDGKGQQRALKWYNQVMTAYKENEAKGAKKDPNFVASIGKTEGPSPEKPSRMTQIVNWAKEKMGSDSVMVINPDGRKGYIPSANLEKALGAGYKKVE